MLEALPLNRNSKIDRQALPVPPRARPAIDASFVAPRTPIEHALVNMWEEVLGLEVVGRHDNFLDLGGHSLQAGQIFTRVLETFGLVLSLRNFFEQPTIARLAMLLTTCLATQSDTGQAS